MSNGCHNKNNDSNTFNFNQKKEENLSHPGFSLQIVDGAKLNEAHYRKIIVKRTYPSAWYHI